MIVCDYVYICVHVCVCVHVYESMVAQCRDALVFMIKDRSGSLKLRRASSQSKAKSNIPRFSPWTHWLDWVTVTAIQACAMHVWIPIRLLPSDLKANPANTTFCGAYNTFSRSCVSEW